MKKGFTLIELVMVMVIIGILAVVALPKFYDLSGQAKNASTKGALGGIRSALAMYYANAAATGTAGYPITIDLAMADGHIPINSLVATDKATVVVVTVGDYAGAGQSANGGWVYDSAAGRAWASNTSSW